jgi:hypothetical protein
MPLTGRGWQHPQALAAQLNAVVADLNLGDAIALGVTCQPWGSRTG